MISALLVAIGLTIGLSPDLQVSYKIDFRLDTVNHKLYGEQTVRFFNPTSESIERIAFHLYPNAFSDTNSAYCAEDGRVKADVASGNISRLDVSEIFISGRAVDSGMVETKGTLMYITLRDELPPGRDLEIDLKFELVIPRAKVRFGHDGKGDYLLSHWYPIICGYQKGELIDREYHANSEFFSNFGSYDVTMRLPSDYVVGATGILDLIDENDSISVWHAVADTVIDFAFACGANFEIFRADTLGIDIEYLLNKENTGLLERINDITKYSLAYCSERLFEYPYDNFTLVDFECGSAGLELPGMIVVSFDDPGRVESVRRTESLIAHEAAHMWFYGTIATNETDEPWLDEGLTSYYTGKIMTARDKTPEFSVLGYDISLDKLSRIFALSRGISFPIDLASYDYPDWFEYESAVYTRAEMTLQCLEIVIGDSTFAKALKGYARKYRFGHPDSDDFKKAISSYSEKDLSGFYSQFVSGTSRVDYAVTGMLYEKIEDEIQRYKVTVTLRRNHDGILPQTVSVRLDDGSVMDTVWDGYSRVAR
ncbi:MAG: M1 family metallopeptidase, partial [candidate division Zixibacteria bacterium]